jgi:hypothetical protein
MVDTIRRWNGTTWVTIYDKATLLQRDGTLPMLGDLTLFRDPVSVLHAVTKQYADNLVLSLAWKDCVHAATTTNITLSGTQTIDGVALGVNNRVLVKNQTTLSQNGIYDVKAGAWVRSFDADSGGDLAMAAVFVALGTNYMGTAWFCNSGTAITPDTTPLQWQQFGGSNFTMEMADGLYVHNVGDTMTGTLTIDNYFGGEFAFEVLKMYANNQAQISFGSDRDNNGAVMDRAAINVTGRSEMILQTYDQGAGGFGTIYLAPYGASALIATPGYTATATQMRAVSTNPQAMIVGAMTAATPGVPGGYIGFYPSNDPSILGTRQGYIGYPSTSTMILRNDDVGGISIVAAAGGNVGLTSSLGNIALSASTAAQIMTFAVGGTTRFRIDSGGVDVTGGLTTSTTANFTGKVTAVAGLDVNGGSIRSGGNGPLLSLIDTSTALSTDEHDCYMQFYGNGDLTSGVIAPGTRTGWFGFAASATMQMINEATNGGIRLQAAGSGTLALVTGASGDVSILTGAAGNILLNSNTGVTVFSQGGAERGRATASFLWGKSSGGTALVGVEIFEGGTIYSTTVSTGSPNMLLRHNTDLDNQAYIQFANSTGGILSAITQDDVAPVGVKFANCTATAPSDYRWKDDLGPVMGALDRVMLLQPKHLRWKKSGIEFDGFIAHEAGEVVPYLVSGEKDAVTDEGEIEGQGFDYGGATALLTAAVQELNNRLMTLENR